MIAVYIYDLCFCAARAHQRPTKPSFHSKLFSAPAAKNFQNPIKTDKIPQFNYLKHLYLCFDGSK
jgi:hypothetical protein